MQHYPQWRILSRIACIAWSPAAWIKHKGTLTKLASSCFSSVWLWEEEDKCSVHHLSRFKQLGKTTVFCWCVRQGQVTLPSLHHTRRVLLCLLPPLLVWRPPLRCSPLVTKFLTPAIHTKSPCNTYHVMPKFSCIPRPFYVSMPHMPVYQDSGMPIANSRPTVLHSHHRPCYHLLFNQPN